MKKMQENWRAISGSACINQSATLATAAHLRYFVVMIAIRAITEASFRAAQSCATLSALLLLIGGRRAR